MTIIRLVAGLVILAAGIGTAATTTPDTHASGIWMMAALLAIAVGAAIAAFAALDHLDGPT